MENLYATKYMIEGILEKYPETRDDDDLLYLAVIERFGEEQTSIGRFLRKRREMGIPPFETVRRCRQKAQAEKPELKGRAAQKRAEKEETFKDFARN